MINIVLLLLQNYKSDCFPVHRNGSIFVAQVRNILKSSVRASEIADKNKKMTQIVDRISQGRYSIVIQFNSRVHLVRPLFLGNRKCVTMLVEVILKTVTFRVSFILYESL